MQTQRRGAVRIQTAKIGESARENKDLPYRALPRPSLGPGAKPPMSIETRVSTTGRVRIPRRKSSRITGERPKTGRWRKWLRRLCVEAALCLATSGLVNGLFLMLLSGVSAHSADRCDVWLDAVSLCLAGWREPGDPTPEVASWATLAITGGCSLFLSVYGIRKRAKP